jgi:hypothetical protein
MSPIVELVGKGLSLMLPISNDPGLRGIGDPTIGDDWKKLVPFNEVEIPWSSTYNVGSNTAKRKTHTFVPPLACRDMSRIAK